MHSLARKMNPGNIERVIGASKSPKKLLLKIGKKLVIKQQLCSEITEMLTITSRMRPL